MTMTMTMTMTIKKTKPPVNKIEATLGGQFELLIKSHKPEGTCFRWCQHLILTFSWLSGVTYKGGFLLETDNLTLCSWTIPRTLLLDDAKMHPLGQILPPLETSWFFGRGDKVTVWVLELLIVWYGSRLPWNQGERVARCTRKLLFR